MDGWREGGKEDQVEVWEIVKDGEVDEGREKDGGKDGWKED